MWYTSLISLVMIVVFMVMVVMSHSFKGIVDDTEQRAKDAEFAAIEAKTRARDTERANLNAEGRINTLSIVVVSICKERPDLNGCNAARQLIQEDEE